MLDFELYRSTPLEDAITQYYNSHGVTNPQDIDLGCGQMKVDYELHQERLQPQSWSPSLPIHLTLPNRSWMPGSR